MKKLHATFDQWCSSSCKTGDELNTSDVEVNDLLCCWLFSQYKDWDGGHRGFGKMPWHFYDNQAYFRLQSLVGICLHRMMALCYNSHKPVIYEDFDLDNLIFSLLVSPWGRQV